MPPKRPGGSSSSSPTASKVKLPKLDREPDDFSSVVKNKLQAYTRTGQACDRCKVRKIRCDALPQGCSHCANQNLECFVTDRVTGRTERRGYMQDLEREKTDMMDHIRALEKALESKGFDVLPWKPSPAFNAGNPPGVTFDASGNPLLPAAEPGKGRWSQVGSVWLRDNDTTRPNTRVDRQIPALPSSSTLESRTTEAHCGVVSDLAPLSSIKGTKLSILGTTIDITSFVAPDMDDLPPFSNPGQPLYNHSVQAFLQSIYRVNPAVHVDLPPRDDAFEYSEWYFLMCFPFVPLLHKPSFLSLLARVYDDPAFVPTPCELVVVHMVFATIYFQYGVRNRQDVAKRAQLNALSQKHYHYCLSKFYDISVDMTITSVQALTLMGFHTRCFPKPGCGYLIASHAYLKAIELGLNKAAPNVLNGSVANLETEVRSRSWWGVLVLSTVLNGHLGRPMMLGLQDYDVPLPLAIPDEFITTEGITDRSLIGHCSYHAGLMIFKITPLYLEMYTTLYSVRRDPRRYEETVARLEQQLQEWKAALPHDLRIDDTDYSGQRGNVRLFRLILKSLYIEFRILLRHPSVCTSANPEYQAENTRICEEMSRDLLKLVCTVLKLKSQDTTWYQLSTYVAAVFCTLVANWERRFRITHGEVLSLRQEMKQWLGIIEEIGFTLGTQTGVCNDVSQIINTTIAAIEADMGRTQGSIPHRTALSQIRHGQSGKTQPSPPNTDESTPDGGSAQGNGSEIYYHASPATYSHLGGFGNQSHSATNSVSPATGLPENYGPSNDAYHTTNTLPTAASVIPIPISTSTDEPRPAQPAGTNPRISFASQATQQLSGFQGQGDGGVSVMAHEWSGNKTWSDWTSALSDWQDRYSANTLLNLGGVATGSLEQVPHQLLNGQQHQMPHGEAAAAGIDDLSQQQWPLLVFNTNNGPSVNGA